MKLYAFQPKGFGSYSFFTIAKNEDDARLAIRKHIINNNDFKDFHGNIVNEAKEWESEWYILTVVEEMGVIVNDNQ